MGSRLGADVVIVNVEYEFQGYIFFKHIRQFIVLILFLALVVWLAINYLRMDKTMAAYVLIGVLTSLLASLIFIYPESREHYLRGQYKLLAIAETAALTSKDLGNIIGANVLIEPMPTDEELKSVYTGDNRKMIEKEVRSFLPGFQERIELLVLSSPELEVSDWEDLYHAKRDIDVQSTLPAGVNDLIFTAKALRLMEEMGQKSIFLRDYIKRPGTRR